MVPKDCMNALNKLREEYEATVADLRSEIDKLKMELRVVEETVAFHTKDIENLERTLDNNIP